MYHDQSFLGSDVLSPFSISLLRFSLGTLSEKGTRQKTLQLAYEELQK